MPLPGQPGHDAAVQEVIRLLENGLLKPCQNFEAYNTGRIEVAANEHQSALRRLAWGMAGVGGLGATTGTLLGYAITRGLRQSFRQLAIQIRDAAGEIDGLTEESDPESVREAHEDLAAATSAARDTAPPDLAEGLVLLAGQARVALAVVEANQFDLATTHDDVR